MDTRVFAYVAKLADTGSYARAAQELFITKQGLASAIERLERSMGVPLFEADRKGVRLTEYGHVFCSFSRMFEERHRAMMDEIEQMRRREEQFSYDPSFVERFPAAPLSVALPFQGEPYSARRARPFFRNLLPEGAALAAVARKLEVKSSSYLKVLDALGSECIGAVVLGREDVEAPAEAYGYEPLARETVGAVFREGADGVAQLQEEAKLSLAGAQSKMGLYLERKDGVAHYALPCGSAPSTHIVKTSSRRFEQ